MTFDKEWWLAFTVGAVTGCIIVAIFVLSSTPFPQKQARHNPYPDILTLSDATGNFYHLKRVGGTSYEVVFVGTNITWKVD